MPRQSQTVFQNLNLNLRDFVDFLAKDDIRTPKALIARLTDDLAATVMAEHIISWMPYSTKSGGWVYKSWRDWYAECGITQAQVSRVRKSGILEVIGFEVKLMRANGSPTLHYRLNTDRFAQAIAANLGIATDVVQPFFAAPAQPRRQAEPTPAQPNTPAPAQPRRRAEQAPIAAPNPEPPFCFSQNHQMESAETTDPNSPQARIARIRKLKAEFEERQKTTTEAQTETLQSHMQTYSNQTPPPPAIANHNDPTPHNAPQVVVGKYADNQSALADTDQPDSTQRTTENIPPAASAPNHLSGQAHTPHTTPPQVPPPPPPDFAAQDAANPAPDATHAHNRAQTPVEQQNAETVPIPSVTMPGITKRELERFSRMHGADVVEHVIEYAKAQSSLHTPAAWVKSVLKNKNVDLIACGVYAQDSPVLKNGLRFLVGEYAHFIDH